MRKLFSHKGQGSSVAQPAPFVRSIDILKNRIVRHTQVVDGLARQGVGYLADARRRAPGRSPGAYVCGTLRTERFDAARRAFRQDTAGLRMGFRFAARMRRSSCGVHARHVAGDDQVPVGSGVAEGGFDAGQGSGVGPAGPGLPATRDARYSSGGPTIVTLPGRFADRGRDNFDQSAATQHQESFISPHAGTCAPRKHKSRRLHETDDIIRGSDHLGRCATGDRFGRKLGIKATWT